MPSHKTTEIHPEHRVAVQPKKYLGVWVVVTMLNHEQLNSDLTLNLPPTLLYDHRAPGVTFNIRQLVSRCKEPCIMQLNLPRNSIGLDPNQGLKLPFSADSSCS